MVRLDVTGQRYGRFTALEFIGDVGKRKSVWRWRCDCGTVKDIPLNSVRSGNTQSCGCLEREKTAERNRKSAKDLTGFRSGKITVIRRIRSDRYGVVWEYKCDCGSVGEVRSTDVGDVKPGPGRPKTACRTCNRRTPVFNDVDFVPGKRFAHLAVVRVLGAKAIVCKCDCGKETTVSAAELSSGHTKSCGCRRGSHLPHPSKLWEVAGRKLTTQEVCDLFGFKSPQVFRSRIASGMSVEEALSTPVRERRWHKKPSGTEVLCMTPGCGETDIKQFSRTRGRLMPRCKKCCLGQRRQRREATRLQAGS